MINRVVYTYTPMVVRAMLLVMIGAVALSCSKEETPRGVTLFNPLPFSHTGIDFSNNLIEDDQFNIIEYLYFYNGGGVAIGDINNDGLPDIYFSSNQQPNRLYLNLGDFRFEDITQSAGVGGVGNWTTGVTLADVNGDGLLDIFICGVGGYKNFTGRNQLLINRGDLTFTDMTDAFGLSFQGFSTHAVFFDYDNDGDLDMYLLNHSVHTARSYGEVSLRYQHDPKAGDRLYRNELIPSGRSFFTDVTAQAGILSSQIGYGLGVAVSDVNNDGYPDIYVANDFHENDYLYINQRNGTFKQLLEQSLPHSSRFSMGVDITDINNNGWPDIITLDMLPKDEAVIKASAGEDPYEIFLYKLFFGYGYQVARNTLQLNRGVQQDGQLIFSDVAPYAGVEATDWSWGPLLADFDNDGYIDLFVANGIQRRPNDLDYINYISTDSAQRFYTDRQMIDQMPTGSVHNYFFRNRGDLKFENVSAEWTGLQPSFSNGAAYADLDNDGDLDLVVNHIDERATVYRNELPRSNFVSVRLEGESLNRFGVGAKVLVYSGNQMFTRELNPSKGWQSSVDHRMHIGLGNAQTIDSLVVIWPGGKYQRINSVDANQQITLRHEDANDSWDYDNKKPAMLRQVDVLKHLHREDAFTAFETERLIPHSITSQGPKMIVGDVNADGLEDVFICGAKGQPSTLYVQHRSGKFVPSNQQAFEKDLMAEDVNAAFLDANNDGFPDLMVVSGGQEREGELDILRPRLYLNDGRGNLNYSRHSLPDIYLNASCVIAADVDGDGDQDVFIGGRVVAGQYGVSPNSYLLINDGRGNFSDQSELWLPDSKPGMVTDACWHDVNNDGKTDLMLVGEWMPVTILIQEPGGKFLNRTVEYGLEHTNGWWNTIYKADVDNDGKPDFLVGNRGLNSRLRASVDEPVELVAGDIDSNGSIDPVLTYYNKGERYPFASKDQLVKQVPGLKKKYLKYGDFKNAKLEDIIPPARQQEFIHRKAELFASVWLKHTDDGKFTVNQLPVDAQLFPVFSFLMEDINKDGYQDILMVGNWYAVQPDIGRHDAGYGLVLLGSKAGDFVPQSPVNSGFLIRGEGRDIRSITTAKGERIIFVSRNNDTLITFK
jgi:enediyne biosynthesis protein E4